MNHALRQRYEAGSSPLHGLEPRSKVVMTLLLLIGILLIPERSWTAYPLVWAVIGSLAAAGGLSAWRLARLGGLALPFVLAALALPFTMPGQTVFAIGGLTVSDAGLARFISILLKSWLSVQAALLLTMTTPVTDLLWALRRLRVPGILVAVIAFMLRYLDTLQDEAQQLMQARAARSAVPLDGKLRRRWLWEARVAGEMVGSLFLRSYARSERVYASMLARGYDGDDARISGTVAVSRATAWAAIPPATVLLIDLMARL